MLLSPPPFGGQVRSCFNHTRFSDVALPQQEQKHHRGALWRPLLYRLSYTPVHGPPDLICQRLGGEGGIRTHEGLLIPSGLANRRTRPLCDLSL